MDMLQSSIDALLVDQLQRSNGVAIVSQLAEVVEWGRVCKDGIGKTKPAKYLQSRPQLFEMIGSQKVKLVNFRTKDMESSGADAVQALSRLLKSNHGSISLEKFQSLSKEDAAFKGAVDAAGGAKKFVHLNSDHFEWASGLIRFAKHRRDASPNGAGNGLTRGGRSFDDVDGLHSSQTKSAISQDCVAIRSPSFQLEAAHVSLSSQGMALTSSAVAQVDSKGGHDIGFTGADDETSTRSPAYGSSGVAAIQVLSRLLKNNHGSITLEKFQSLSKEDAAFKGVVDAAGSAKKFVHLNSDHFEWAFGLIRFAKHRRDASPNGVGNGLTRGGRSLDDVGGSHRLQSNAASCQEFVPVARLRWCQNVIKARFRNGSLLIDVLQELMTDPGLLQRLPLIDVVRHEGEMYAVSGNRRVWVLKEYAALADSALCIRVRVRVTDKWMQMFKLRHTTKNSGIHADIVLRHHRRNQERFPTMALALGAILRGRQARNGVESCEWNSDTASEVSSDVDVAPT